MQDVIDGRDRDTLGSDVAYHDVLVDPRFGESCNCPLDFQDVRFDGFDRIATLDNIDLACFFELCEKRANSSCMFRWSVNQIPHEKYIVSMLLKFTYFSRLSS